VPGPWLTIPKRSIMIALMAGPSMGEIAPNQRLGLAHPRLLAATGHDEFLTGAIILRFGFRRD
jgi:hypothetical protein